LKKIDKKIIMIIVLLVLFIGIIIAYVVSNNTDTEQILNNNGSQKTNISESTGLTISKTGEIISSLEENLELHATYYFEKVYVEENETVKEGQKLIKYTNGTYLVAPYNCAITELNIPEVEEKCTNKHYISVKAINIVCMNIEISETQIEKIKIGQEATLSVSTIEKNYTGYIIKVSSTASNGNFTTTVQFENDGNLKIGMTGKCTINVI